LLLLLVCLAQVNPPFAIPLVELVPAPWTDAHILAAARELLTKVGAVHTRQLSELLRASRVAQPFGAAIVACLRRLVSRQSH
jgi:3-hydroxyacyl-CoA dehydrogenase